MYLVLSKHLSIDSEGKQLKGHILYVHNLVLWKRGVWEALEEEMVDDNNRSILCAKIALLFMRVTLAVNGMPYRK